MVGPPLGMAQFMAGAAVTGGGIPMPVLAAMAGAAMTGGGAGGGIGGVGGNVGAAPPLCKVYMVPDFAATGDIYMAPRGGGGTEFCCHGNICERHRVSIE